MPVKQHVNILRRNFNWTKDIRISTVINGMNRLSAEFFKRVFPTFTVAYHSRVFSGISPLIDAEAAGKTAHTRQAGRHITIVVKDGFTVLALNFRSDSD